MFSGGEKNSCFANFNIGDLTGATLTPLENLSFFHNFALLSSFQTVLTKKLPFCSSIYFYAVRA